MNEENAKDGPGASADSDALLSSDNEEGLSTKMISPNSLTQTIQHARWYAIYVLILLLTAYLLNQLDRYTLAVCTQPMAQDIHYGDQSCLENTSISNLDDVIVDVECHKIVDETQCITVIGADNTTVCKWDYNGQGTQYQLLVGPVFILIYTFTGIPLGFAADKSNRKNILAVCLIFWSAMTFLTGFAQEYWHLVILRFGLGMGQAGCTPFATSLITDYFSESGRATAIGFYNWGIYVGYSMAYAVGNFITQAKSWRWAFFIAGIPGFVLGVLIILTMMEPERKKIPKENNQEMKVSEYNSLSFCSKVGRVAKPFCNPSLLFICFAGAVRNGAGYVWAYNTQPFFDQYYPEVNTGMWLSWIPLVSGSISVVLGGFIADRVVKKSGPVGRIWVIVVSLLLASPFAALTLWLAPPWAFIMQIPTYIFGEMWVGVTLTVIVELVPSTIRTAAIAVYFFIISNIGGTMPLLVTPLADLTNLKIALLILYPGMYVTGALLYVTTLFVLKRDIDKAHNMDALTYSLLKDSEKSDGTSDVEDDTKKPSYGTVEN